MRGRANIACKKKRQNENKTKKKKKTKKPGFSALGKNWVAVRNVWKETYFGGIVY